jgi:hypothetical protein
MRQSLWHRRSTCQFPSSINPPLRAKGHNVASFDDTVAKWQASRDADEAWLHEHKDSPYVQQAIEGVRSSTGFRSLLLRKGRPQFNPRTEKPEEHQQDVRRFDDKVQRILQWKKAG